MRSLDSLRSSLLKHQGNKSVADSTVPRFLQAEETMNLNEKAEDFQVLSRSFIYFEQLHIDFIPRNIFYFSLVQGREI